MDESRIDQRLSRLEAIVEGLASSVNTLAASVTTSSKTNWGVIISGIALIITIVTTLGYIGIAKPQKEQAIVNQAFQREYREHTSNGHPFTVQKEVELRNSAQDKVIHRLEEEMTFVKGSRYSSDMAELERFYLLRELDALKEKVK